MGKQNYNSGSVHVPTAYIIKNDRRNNVGGTETNNLSCSTMNRYQDTGYTVREHGGCQYGTDCFGTGKGVCSVVSRRIKMS